MPVISKIADTCRLYPQRPAVISSSGEITYRELQELTNRLAAGFARLGIHPGNRVMLALENGPELILAFYALLQAGAVLVPVDPLYTTYELGSLVRETSPVMVICSAGNLPTYLEIAGKQPFPAGIVATGSGRFPKGVYPFADLLKASSGPEPRATCRRDEVAEIIYTPGNTGMPKGVMLTAQNLYSCAAAFASFCQLAPEDRALLLAPAYRSSVQCCALLAPMFSGAAVVTRDKWPASGQLLKVLEEERISFFFGPPTYYALLLKEQQANGDSRPASLRVAYCTGGQLPPSLAQAFAQRFGLEITEGYCLTEATSIVCSNPLQGTKKPGSAGLPFPGTEVRIVDYEGRPLPPGQVGEIVVRGPGVMKGYFGQPEQTRWVLRNGWLHTEDLGYMDGEGYVYLLDRKKNIIIKGGHSIDPREVEDVLYQHPQVMDTVVVGVPDPVMGEEVMALVMLRENQQAEPDELRAFCARMLAPYKVPGKIQLVSELPKTTSGKLLRQGLKGSLKM